MDLEKPTDGPNVRTEINEDYSQQLLKGLKYL